MESTWCDGRQTLWKFGCIFVCVTQGRSSRNFFRHCFSSLSTLFIIRVINVNIMYAWPPCIRFEEIERAATSGGKEKEDVSDIVAEENRKRKRKLEKKEKEKAAEKGKRYKDSFKFWVSPLVVPSVGPLVGPLLPLPFTVSIAVLFSFPSGFGLTLLWEIFTRWFVCFVVRLCGFFHYSGSTLNWRYHEHLIDPLLQQHSRAVRCGADPVRRCGFHFFTVCTTTLLPFFLRFFFYLSALLRDACTWWCFCTFVTFGNTKKIQIKSWIAPCDVDASWVTFPQRRQREVRLL